MPTEPPRTDDHTASAVLDLLRGQVPPSGGTAASADAALRWLECGGYLYSLWRPADRLASLPRLWAEALERSHRKTLLDTLAALADFRSVGRMFVEEGVPFLLLKGGAYLADLYDDPGQRPLTDIDLLVRPADAIRMYGRLKDAGYETVQWDDEYRRFEVIAPGAGRCSFEVHWTLGLSERSIDQDEVWDRSDPVTLEGVPCRRLGREDAILFHVAHQADHFFGPSLKWVIDLHLMLRRWSPDAESLIERAERWRVRTALALSARYLDKILPGDAPGALTVRLRLGRVRRGLLGPFFDPDPLKLLAVGDGRVERYLAASLLRDRPADVLGGLARVIRRPFVWLRTRNRTDGAPPQHWH